MIKKFGNDLLLLEKVAAGGMAEVFRAKQIGVGGFKKTVAVKRILPQFVEKPEFKKMFSSEAQLCAELHHPNIVQVFSNGEFEKYLYIIMEYVNGQNVRQLLAVCDKMKVRIPIELTLFIISESAKGLNYAHNLKDDISEKSLNIIHRDISPQNIMLSYKGDVKIVDFGIAKAANSAEQTRAGILKGKFGYMSPEQANGESLDSRSDIFSLGIVLYELLTQRRLFTTKEDLKTLKLVQECVVPDPSKYNPKINSDLSAIILKCLQKDKNNRFQSGKELSKELSKFLKENFKTYNSSKLPSFLGKIFEKKINTNQQMKNQINTQLKGFDFTVFHKQNNTNQEYSLGSASKSQDMKLNVDDNIIGNANSNDDLKIEKQSKIKIADNSKNAVKVTYGSFQAGKNKQIVNNAKKSSGFNFLRSIVWIMVVAGLGYGALLNKDKITSLIGQRTVSSESNNQQSDQVKSVNEIKKENTFDAKAITMSDQAKVYGYLSLSSIPQADKIYINNELQEELKMPIKKLNLKPGSYNIKLESSVWSLSWEKTIEITDDKEIMINNIILNKP